MLLSISENKMLIYFRNFDLNFSGANEKELSTELIGASTLIGCVNGGVYRAMTANVQLNSNVNDICCVHDLLIPVFRAVVWFVLWKCSFNVGKVKKQVYFRYCSTHAFKSNRFSELV